MTRKNLYLTLLLSAILASAFLSSPQPSVYAMAADGYRHTHPGEEPEFSSCEFTEYTFQRICGYSYAWDCSIPPQELRLLTVAYYGFDGQSHRGELVVNKHIADNTLDVFRELYEIQYPVGQLRLIDEYQGDDEASASANNTSCFNYRKVPGRDKLSLHSYGLAIDINPLYNPYIRQSDGQILCTPIEGLPYEDRTQEFPYKITHEDPCYLIFTSHGFLWGGDWNSEKDYQHFYYPAG